MKNQQTKEFYLATLTLRNKLSIATTIAKNLTPTQRKLFENTCFGPWLKVQQPSGDGLLTHLFLQTMTKDLPEGIPCGDHEIWFHFPPTYTRFGREEFCLVTGLRFGRHDEFGPYTTHIGTPSWLHRVFPDLAKEKLSIHVDDLDRLHRTHGFTRMADLDVVRVCLLLLLYIGFLGIQDRQPVSKDLVLLVDDLDAWNVFPWGSYIWKRTYKQLSSAIEGCPRVLKHVLKHGSRYTLLGFIWAFKIWIFEAFPNMRTYAIKCLSKIPGDNIPRAITWKRIRQKNWDELLPYMKIDHEDYPLQTLTPTEAEAATDWWQASKHFFDGTDDPLPPLFHRVDSALQHRDPSPHQADYSPQHRDPSSYQAYSPTRHRDPSPIPSSHRADPLTQHRDSSPIPSSHRTDSPPRHSSPRQGDELDGLRDTIGALRDEVGVLRSDNGALLDEVGALRDEVGALREIVSLLQKEMCVLREERQNDMLHNDECYSEPDQPSTSRHMDTVFVARRGSRIRRLAPAIISPYTPIDQRPRKKKRGPNPIVHDPLPIVQNASPIIQDTHLIVQSPPLKVHNTPHIIQDPPLKVQSPPLIIQDPLLKVQNPPRIIRNPPLKVQNPPCIIRDPNSILCRILIKPPLVPPMMDPIWLLYQLSDISIPRNERSKLPNTIKDNTRWSKTATEFYLNERSKGCFTDICRIEHTHLFLERSWWGVLLGVENNGYFEWGVNIELFLY